MACGLSNFPNAYQAELLSVTLPLYPQMSDGPGPRRGRARSRIRRALTGMCGIAGVLNPRGIPVPRVLLERMTDAIAHRGPDGEGHSPTGRWASATGAWRSSILSPRAISRWRRRRATSSSPTTARSTTSRSCGSSWSGSATASARTPTPKSSSMPTRSGAQDCVEALQRHVRVRDLGQRAAAPVPGPRPLRHQAALLRTRRRRVPLRLRDQGDPRASRRSGVEVEPPASARVLHLPERLHRPDAVRGRPAAARRLPPDAIRPDGASEARPLLGLRRSPSRATTAIATRVSPRSSTACFARPSRASSSATCRVGAYLVGGMDSGIDHRRRRAALPRHRRPSPAASTSRPPRASSSGSTSAPRPRRCRTCSRPSTTRWC